MIKHSLIAATFALGGFATIAFAQTATPMQPGHRMATTAPLGNTTVREVMFGDSGATVMLVFDAAKDRTQAARVVRIENVNGMLEITYDSTMPTRPLASGGTPRLVPQSDGMYRIEYDR